MVIHPLLKRLQSYLRFSFLDDLTLDGQADTVARDVKMIDREAATLGLTLNKNKCELVFITGQIHE